MTIQVIRVFSGAVLYEQHLDFSNPCKADLDKSLPTHSVWHSAAKKQGCFQLKFGLHIKSILWQKILYYVMKKSNNPINAHPWGMELFKKIKMSIYHVIDIYSTGQKIKRWRERVCKYVYVFNRLLKQAAEWYNSLGPTPQCFKSRVYYKAWSSSCGIHLFASCLFPDTDTHADAHWI